ncbi:hypothetical protein ASPWEDRAFT_60083 [Aspergillus wentii DTO 134E9]|uniref:Alpha-1,2-mannosyltransferase n=1 Tax=Aspergillus wentii DTO 134E9 TaxID=1073089 RepID=A0A1L9RLY9_ASPWE|nr:uncharacterized protein ASPWEDRAFT_60083 [Aspergillus wentii DTO 134E9]OJJ35941.1 hypothetical protein ASPWEDRAFT_60083 [Aspergillus wentii DTO 134E9]
MWSVRSHPQTKREQLRLQLSSLLHDHKPNCAAIQLDGDAGGAYYNASDEGERLNCVKNVDEIFPPMQAAHDGFLRAIQDQKVQLPYLPQTAGIVSSAGGTYLPNFIVTLRLIRRRGSNLPVEVFMKDWEEYEAYICEVVLPPMNAKCLILSEMLSGLNKMEHYQIKSFAILFSSFESVIWLDSDNIPLHDPGILLNSEPFTSTGLVTWPDFWASTTAPIYYNISRQPEPSLSARACSEAGVILVSKQSHASMLLLSAYYNYYGPDYYYPLLSQGGYGQGDKDTFIPAAAAMNKTFYTVSEPVVFLGHTLPHSEDVHPAAMLQSDPIEDFQLTSEGKWRVKDPSVAKPVRAFFIHTMAMKFNPADGLMGEKSHDWHGNPSRAYTASAEALQRFGYDAERDIWEETLAMTCDLEHVFYTWRSKSGVCAEVRAYWNAVYENPSKEETYKFTQD